MPCCLHTITNPALLPQLLGLLRLCRSRGSHELLIGRVRPHDPVGILYEVLTHIVRTLDYASRSLRHVLAHVRNVEALEDVGDQRMVLCELIAVG